MPALYTSNTKPDTLKADAYIIYMMLGDYFKSCTCDNTRLEKKLYLNYKDFSFNKQFSREEKIISKVESLGEEYLDSLAGIDAKVRITIDDMNAVLLFYTEDMKAIIKATVDKRGAIVFTA